jgi:multisubunit Na+/H+ antiporter MnhE subunit
MCAIARKPAYNIDFPILVIANENGGTLSVYVSDDSKVGLVHILNVQGRADSALRHEPIN